MSTSSNPRHRAIGSLSSATTTRPGPMPSSAEVAPPQAMLVTSAIAILREHGYVVRRGLCGDLDTAEVAVTEGRSLVLLPMAETMWGAVENFDVDVWLLRARDAEGRYVEFPRDVDWPWHCPSVLWAHSLGLDPAAAVFMTQVALADEYIRAHFGLCA
jgi:hypothetical protein